MNSLSGRGQAGSDVSASVSDGDTWNQSSRGRGGFGRGGRGGAVNVCQISALHMKLMEVLHPVNK